MGLANRKFHDIEPLESAGFGGSPDGGQRSLRQAVKEPDPSPPEPQNLANVSHSRQEPPVEIKTFSSGRPAAERPEIAEEIAEQEDASARATDVPVLSSPTASFSEAIPGPKP